MNEKKNDQLLLSAQMIRAILEGRKTQARIGIVPPPAVNKAGKPYWRTPHNTPQQVGVKACPLGKVGERLWVREAYTSLGLSGMETYYKATRFDEERQVVHRSAWHPGQPISFVLDITQVRTEQLHEITPQDCLAEGCPPTVAGCNEREKANALRWFRQTWEAEYGADDWAANPWVWVITFR